MDSNTRTAVVAAAVTAAGPVGDNPAAWQARVQQNAVSIAVMASEKHEIAKAIEAIEESKVFTGTVVGVKKEKSSTRGVITLFTGTDRAREGVPEGCEQVRTERTDNPNGMAMAMSVREMVGQRVKVWVEVEEYNNGAGKVRVLRHFEAQGQETRPEVLSLLPAPANA